jgi:hypothetical protein
MKRWKKIVAVAGATAGIASASVAAISVVAAPAIDPAAPPVQTGYCDHHTAAMDQMHDAMGGGMMGVGMMGVGMMGGGVMGSAPDLDALHRQHHPADSDRQVRQ